VSLFTAYWQPVASGAGSVSAEVQMRAVLLGLALVACSGKDTDTGSETGPDTDPDIPPTFLGFTEKPSDVERVGDELRAAVVRVAVETDGTWTIGEQLAGGRLTGTGNFSVALSDDGPGGSIEDLPGGRRGALYLPVVFDDSNRDDAFVDGSDDLVLGFAHDRWLVWLEQGAGAEEPGWAVVDPTGEQWVTYALTEQAVVRLRGLSAVARLNGIYEGSEASAGVIAVDERILTGDDYSPWLALDVAIKPDSGQFEATIDSRPIIGAFQFPEGSIRYVRAVALLYRDADVSGTYDAEGGDTLSGAGLCFGGEPLVLRYSDTPRTIAVARELDRLGWTSGWRWVTGAYPSATEIPRGDMRWARFADDCAVGLPE
jgi:hypothetical protein